MTSKLMSIDELLMRMSMARAYRSGRSVYMVSYAVYKRMEEAIEYYLNTGELVEGRYGDEVYLERKK